MSEPCPSRPLVLPERCAIADYEQSGWLAANRQRSMRFVSRFRLLSLVLASNFSLDLYSARCSSGDAPGPRQPPFNVGISIAGPICPVMSSRCLSAGSFRFLVPPVPTGAFGFPCGQLTRRLHWLACKTPVGLSCSTPVRCNWGGSPSLLRGCLVSFRSRNIGWTVHERSLPFLPPISRASSSLSTTFR